MPRRRVTFDTVRRIALALPGVEEALWYGTPSFKVKKKGFVRLREDGQTLVVICGFEERDLRMQSRPDVFFNLPHYYGYPTVLIHLARVTERDLRDVIGVAWRRAAPRSLLAELQPLSRGLLEKDAARKRR